MHTNVKTKPDGTHVYESVEGGEVKTYEEILAERERDGITGDISPNVEHQILLRQFVNKFEHNFGTASAEDAYFIISKANLGKDKDGDPEPDILLSLHGAPEDISAVLAFSMAKDPVILAVVEKAVMYAKHRMVRKQLGGLFDGLAKVFGHENAEEWSKDVRSREQKPDTTTDKTATDGNK